MSDWIDCGEDLRIPFIFVPHGQPESSEVTAFKARYPDWFSIPATFVPPSEARRHANEAPLPEYVERTPPPDEEASFPPPPTIRRRFLRQGEAGSTLRAFQRANALHGDPVAALRALRDAPEAFADGIAVAKIAATDGFDADPVSGQADLHDANYFVTDPGDAARGLGMPRREFGKALHSLKSGTGLRGDDNGKIHIPSGNVYFND